MAPKKTTNQQLILGANEPSLLFSINELLQKGGIDFDEWWDEYRKGFPLRNQAVTNFRKEDWIVPKFIDITPARGKNIGRTIEYFPDRDDVTTSYILSGTDRDLVHHITAIGYQQSTASGGVSAKNSKPPLKGFPLIELRFVSVDRRYGVKWLRLAGFTDDEGVAATKLAKLLTQADIKRFAGKVKTIFGDSKYVWRKGKATLSYSGQIARLQGLEGYAYVRNRADGENLFTSLLQVVDLKPDRNGFNYDGEANKAKYQKKTAAITVAGEKVVPEEKRPIADCVFDSARLLLPLRNKPINLVKRDVVLYK